MYKLEKYRNKAQKHICPHCQKQSFVRYVDEAEKPIDKTVGRCDREDKCGYHKPPKEWFTENQPLTNGYSFIYNKPTKATKPTARPATVQAEKPQKKPAPIGTIPFHYIEDSAKIRNSNFVYYLFNLFDWETIKRTLDPYFIGCTKNMSVVFPQIDAQGRCRTAKIMQYDRETGKRVHSIDWFHSRLKKRKELPEDFNLQICLFGEHLIRSERNKDKTICIVESEKTALIASACLPQYVWMAAGSLSWLNVTKLEPLRGRNIILYPDASIDGNTFRKWLKIADLAQSQGHTIRVSDLLERKCSVQQKHDGYDIADYLIDLLLSKSVHVHSPEQVEQREHEQPDILLEMINRNPALGLLIERLGLERV